MATNPTRKPPLEDPKINIRLRLSALWASLMFCYVYGDYFGLYVPGKVGELLAGTMGPLGAVTPGVLVAVSAMMAIPSLMVVLSLVLSAGLTRWLNIATALAYTAIIAMTMPGAWTFYIFLGVIEVLLTLTIVVSAWRWPRQGTGAS